MIKKLFYVLLFSPLLFTGCAGLQPLPHDKGKAIKTSNTAVSYYQINKRIEYNELLYKVLWNESRKQEAVFGPLWDIDSELSSRLSNGLNRSGFNTKAIQTILSEPFIDQYKALYLESDMPGIEVRIKDYKIELSQELQTELLVQQVDYLLTIYSDYIYSYAQIGVKQIASRSQISIVDIKENKEIYFGPMVFGGSPKVEKSIREIENNNLAKFKEIMRDGIDFIVEKPIPMAIGLISKK